MLGVVLAALTAAQGLQPGAVAAYRTEGAAYYTTVGTVNPNEGAIEVVIRPCVDLNEKGEGWPFAVRVFAKEKGPRKEVLGVYQPTWNDPKMKPAVFGRAMTDTNEPTAIEWEPPVRAGETAVYALTWKSGDRVCLYRNGRLVGEAAQPGPLAPVSPYLILYDARPLFASRLRVSTRALPADELQADPARPFTRGLSTSLLVNDLDAPQYFVTPTLGHRRLVPFDRLSDRVFREGDDVTLKFVEYDPARGVAGRVVSKSVGRLPAGLHDQRWREGSFRVSVLPKAELTGGALRDYLGVSFLRDAELVAKTGVRWERLWNYHELLWFQVEPQAGEFDFREADRTIQASVDRGIGLLATLGCPPPWAGVRPDVTGPNGKLFEDNPNCCVPRSLDEWRRYVRTSASRYRGKIHHWEIWNEVDWMPPGRAASFNGTVADYFSLLKAASEEIRAVDPSNKVVVSGFGTGVAATEKVSERLCEMGATDLVDIWNMHAYKIREKAAEYRDVPRRFNPGLPVWQTEFMWHVISDKDRQAYLGDAIHNWYLEEGYEKFFDFGVEYLLDEHTNSLEPPMQALAVQQTYFEGCSEFLGRIAALPPVDFDVAHAFRRTDGSCLSMLGSSMGRYAVRLASEPQDVRDTYGARVEIVGKTLELNGKILFVVTKEPLDISGFEVRNANQLVRNGGFEDLAGDDLDGIDKCQAQGWEPRFDRCRTGFVGISTNALTGRFSLRMRPAKEGLRELYALSPVRIPAAGWYRLTAKAKIVNGSPTPYVQLFQMKPEGWLRGREKPGVSCGETVDLHMNVEVPEAFAEPVAVIVGVRGLGEVLFDDVRFERFEKPALDEDDSVLPPLAGHGGRLVRAADEIVDLDAARPLGVGIRYWRGIPFRLTGGWLTAAGRNWQNAEACATLPLGGVCASEIHTLGAVMYQPERAETPATLELVYTDATAVGLPVRAGRDICDWFLVGHPEAKPVVRWEAPGSGLDYGLFLGTFRNPHPEKPLAALRLRAQTSGVVALKAVALRKSVRQDTAGGFCVIMRYDDNHAAAEWRAVAKQFDDRGLKMALAIIPAEIRDERQWQTLREIAGAGHELMDHTAQHGLFRMQFLDRAQYDKAKARGYPFVKDWDDGGLRLYFMGDVDVDHPENFQFTASVHGVDNACVLTDVDPSMAGRLPVSRKFYEPKSGRIYAIGSAGSPCIVRDFWCRGIQADPGLEKTEFVGLSDKAFSFPDEMVRLQADYSRKLFREHGLPPPRAWCQPGGWEPFLPTEKVAAVYGRAELPSMDYLDLSDDLERFKERVREGRRDDRPVQFLCHLSGGRVGGWTRWLQLNGEFLDWLKRERIPVRTPSSWTRQCPQK